MKLGEAAGRLAKLDVLAPDGVRWATTIASRNFLMHQYDEIDRQITRATLAVDMPEWKASLAALFDTASAHVAADDVTGRNMRPLVMPDASRARRRVGLA